MCKNSANSISESKEMVEISRLQDLGWDKTQKIQEEAIKHFSNDESFDFNILIKDAPKKIMADLVEVVVAKNLDEQCKSINGLLYLLQDLSWPSSDRAMDLLKSFPKERLLPELESTLQEAYEENDDNWLGNLKMLIKYHSCSKDDFKNIDLVQVLEKAAY